MFQTACQHLRLGIFRQFQRFMHLAVGKLGEAAVVEARDNVGIPAAGFYQAAVVMVEARQGKHFLHTVFRHRGAYAFH